MWNAPLCHIFRNFILEELIKVEEFELFLPTQNEQHYFSVLIVSVMDICHFCVHVRSHHS